MKRSRKGTPPIIGGVLVLLALLTFGPNAEATLTAWCGETTGYYTLATCDVTPNGKHHMPTMFLTEYATGSGPYNMEVYVQYTGGDPNGGVAIALDKRVFNHTGIDWTGFDLEVTNNLAVAWDMTYQPIDTQEHFSLTSYTDQGMWWDGWLPNEWVTGFWFAVVVPVEWNNEEEYWEGHFDLGQVPKFVPEPTTILLLGLGLAGLGFARRRLH